MVKELSKEEIQERIAKRVALELPNNSLVNLGIGLPTKVARFLPEGVTIMLQSENGFVGLDKVGDDIDPTIVNAGGQPVGIVPGGAFFDSTTSFGIIRDRKSTRLNSSHANISYAVFCLKKNTYSDASPRCRGVCGSALRPR